MRTVWFFPKLSKVLCLLYWNVYVCPAALSPFPSVPKVLLFTTPLPQLHNKPTILDLCAKQLEKAISQIRTVFIVFGMTIIAGPRGHAENRSNLGTDSNRFISSLIRQINFSNLCLVLISPSQPSVFKHTPSRYQTSAIISWDQKKLLNVGCSEDKTPS